MLGDMMNPGLDRYGKYEHPVRIIAETLIEV